MSEEQELLIRLSGLIREKNPLIHCITSPIAINDCANIVLALGARPIMAEHPAEVAGITGISSSLSVSLANITDARMESVMIAGRKAFSQGKPSVIDCVGVNCSQIRMELAGRFLRECSPAVIKGNASEIRALAGVSFGEAGIDTAFSDRVSFDNPGSVEAMGRILKEFSRKTGSVVLASGIIDMMSDGSEVLAVENGCPSMALVTGTGCMLSCIIAAYLSSSESPLQAALCGTALLGTAGETAEQLCRQRELDGLGSYHIALIDALSSRDPGVFTEKMKVRRV